MMVTTQNMVLELAEAAGSQARIARLLGIHSMMLSNYATGKWEPKAERAELIRLLWLRRDELTQKRIKSDEFESQNRAQLVNLWSKL